MARLSQDGFEMGVSTYWFWSTHHTGISHMSTGVSSAAANSGTYSYRQRRTQTTYGARRTGRAYLGADITEVFTRVEIRPSNNIASIMGFHGLRDCNRERVVSIGYVNGTDLSIYLDGAQIGTITNCITLDVFNRIELRCLIDDTNGVVEVKVNGNNLFSWTGDTKGARTDYIAYVVIGFAGATIDTNFDTNSSYDYIDDVAVNDTSGTVNNSWCGKGSILLLKPKGVGNYSQFTPSNNTYDNWELVDEVPHDSDATYVYSDTVDEIDTYEMETLAVDKGIDPTELVIKAVQVCLTGRYEGADAHLAPYFRSGANEEEGAKIYLDGTYGNVRYQVFNVSPFTSAAWTYEEVDGLEAGVKHKAHSE